MKSLKLPRNKLVEIVISYFHWFSILLGIVFVVISHILPQLLSADKDISSLLQAVLTSMGGSLLSIGLVTIFYDKWKEQKEEETKAQFFLMSPTFLGRGEELKEIANIDRKSGKILLIGEMTHDLVKKEYGFTTLLNNKNLPLLTKDKPLFSYGTSFQFLDKEKKVDYYKAITTAIRKGVSLEVSILYPDESISDNENLDRIVESSKDTIRNFIDLISSFLKDKHTKASNSVGHVELRLSRYFSPCSFSSLEYNDGRIVRSLEFNFMHEGDKGVKMSQVYDNKSSEGTHEQFSDYLFNRYRRLYRESIVALKYPMNNDIVYYVLGIIADVPDKSKDQIKEAICDNNNNLIKIVVKMNDNGEYITSSDANSMKEEDNDDGYNEIGIPVCIRNTIIGKVLIEYKNVTGCLIKPNRSFEVDSNTYLLLGAVTKLPETPNKIKREDISKNPDFIEVKIEEITPKKDEESVNNKGEIIRKVKRIINMS